MQLTPIIAFRGIRGTAALEQVVQAQAKVFAEYKHYLLHRWETYVPWSAEGVR